MPRRVAEDDDWDDEEDDDADDAPDVDDDEPTIPCPHCGREIHEDSQRCPHCENYVSREDAPPSRKSWWLILGVLICLYIVYRWIAG